jgi:hypothetical protein
MRGHLALGNSAIGGVCRQLTSEYLHFSNINVLPSANNIFIARLATRLELLQNQNSRTGFTPKNQPPITQEPAIARSFKSVRWARLGKISGDNQNISYGLKRGKTMAI